MVSIYLDAKLFLRSPSHMVYIVSLSEGMDTRLSYQVTITILNGKEESSFGKDDEYLPNQSMDIATYKRY